LIDEECVHVTISVEKRVVESCECLQCRSGPTSSAPHPRHTYSRVDLPYVLAGYHA
jgi:hypothetical protein